MLERMRTYSAYFLWCECPERKMGGSRAKKEKHEKVSIVLVTSSRWRKPRLNIKPLP